MAQSPEIPADDAICLAFIEEKYQEEIEAHKERPCNWCKEERTGSLDCGTPGAIKATVFYGVLWYNASPPRHYRREQTQND